jgi:formylglycine-generating enzyme required for sulfatase activity
MANSKKKDWQDPKENEIKKTNEVLHNSFLSFYSLQIDARGYSLEDPAIFWIAEDEIYCRLNRSLWSEVELSSHAFGILRTSDHCELLTSVPDETVTVPVYHIEKLPGHLAKIFYSQEDAAMFFELLGEKIFELIRPHYESIDFYDFDSFGTEFDYVYPMACYLDDGFLQLVMIKYCSQQIVKECLCQFKSFKKVFESEKKFFCQGIVCKNEIYPRVAEMLKENGHADVKIIRAENLKEDLFALLDLKESKGKPEKKPVQKPAPDPAADVKNKYMILDLRDYSVNYLEDVPEGGWTYEHKTVKLVLRYIPAGSFTMGSPESEIGRREGETQHEVTLTRPFYMGIYPVTGKQYRLIGENGGNWFGNDRPIDVSYSMIHQTDERIKKILREKCKNSEDFIEKLRRKSKLNFDIPTEAQWEYACRAGTTTAWNDGSDITGKFFCPHLGKLALYCHSFKRHLDPCNNRELPGPVGLRLPNAWGLYDMHGNIEEYCLDWYCKEQSADPATDPKGPETGIGHVLRGGCCQYTACGCRSAQRGWDPHGWGTFHGHQGGIRLTLTL